MSRKVMLRSIDNVQQELEQIKQETKLAFRDLYPLYHQYLSQLSQSVKKQLILAAYQICTHIYPDEFLELSLNERFELQKTFKKLSQSFHDQLFSFLQNSLDFKDQDNLLNHSLEIEKDISRDIFKSLDHSNHHDPMLEDKFLESQEIIDPEILERWYLSLDKEVSAALYQLSHQSNYRLQQTRILPSQLPTKILEMAIQAEGQGSSNRQIPNLLDLVIETKKEDDKDKHFNEESAIRITAINLKLSELEFVDPQLGVLRKKIRNQGDKVKKIRERYRQNRKDFAKVKADAAWRSSLC